MKKSIQGLGALLLALILILGGCLWFARQKSGLFIDEIYTYGLSNSHYAPFLNDMTGGSLEGATLTRQQLMDYLVVNDGESLDFASVYYNQVHDVHPPLYYWLMNIACSLTPNVFSYWSGLILNLILYLLTAVLLYALSFTLFEDRLNAALAALLYGLSALGLSTMLMIRMYVLMALLTVQLALILARMIRKPRPIHYFLFAFTLFLGLMTQYYFVFYAFFLCLGYGLWRLARREWKQAFAFALCAFAGVGLLLLAFPACLDHLFAEKMVSGGNAVENLLDSSQYAWRLGSFFRAIVHGMHGVIFAAALVLLALVASLLKKGAKLRFPALSLLVLFPAVPTLLLVAIISPVVEIRYVYNLVPILALWVSLLISLLWQASLFRKRTPRLLLALLLVLIALWQSRAVPPDYLYIEYRDFDAIAAEHRDAPCVYLDDNYFAPITEDIQQLLYFDDVFVTADPDSAALDDYLARYADSEEAVVYVDISKFWSSGFDPEEILPRLLESTEFGAWEPLYTTGLSQTFLLTK